MRRTTLTVEFVTPCFLGGADPSATAEWRAPSVRGQLRWWFRAVAGGRYGGELERVRRAETQVFGSTALASRVRVRTLGTPEKLPRGTQTWGRRLEHRQLAEIWGFAPGLLRAAARLAAEGELEVGDDPAAAGSFFNVQLDRLFGPELEAGATPARGELVVYDAFPTAWPELELDVLTPHQGDDGVPADWHQPVPVAFLTVAPKTTFRFYLRSLDAARAKDDLGHAEALLKAALDWLGAGGKTSAGYGAFGGGEGDGGGMVEESRQPVPETVVWRQATLRWLPGPGVLQATEGSLHAESKVRGLLDGLPEEVRQRLAPKKVKGRKRKKGKPVRCQVTVRRHSERWHEIVALRTL